MLSASRISVVLLVFALTAFTACLEEDDRQQQQCPATAPPTATCISGQQTACPCADGSSSVQVCAAGGFFYDCQCALPPDGGDAGDGSDAGNGGDAGDGGPDADAG